MTTVLSGTPAGTLGAPQDQAGPPLDPRLIALSAAGWVQIALVLPPLHVLLFALNVAGAFWLSRRPWNWIRKYTSFLLAETLYFFVTFQVPRPGSSASTVFSHLLPSGEYFRFLWSAVEVILFLKLGDFVLCRIASRDPRHFSFARLLCFVSYPFTFLAGPVIGFEEFYRSYRPAGAAREDVWYAVRKCAWGGVQVLVVAVWLHGAVMQLRDTVLLDGPLAQIVDTRLLMALWLAGLSVLLHVIYKGYVDVMLGLSRIAGFRLPEQFWFVLFARDPVEYWQHGNRGVYRMTSQHVFNRFFGHENILAKTLMATAVSGIVHALMCPGVTLAGSVLLAALFGASGLVVGAVLRFRRSAVAGRLRWPEAGPAHNARLLAGVALTFTLMAFPRAGFLLLVEGVSVPQWWDLVRRVFVAG